MNDNQRVNIFQPRRFTSTQSAFGDKRFFVYDEVLQIEVFHWHGATGKAKCDAVAFALSALGHEKD